MMISTTHDEAQNNRLRWKSYTIRILAAAFWILVWQLASMWLKQEILLASPVSVVKKLWQFLPQADFWKTVGFSFVRIVSGFLLGLFAGTILAAAACGCKVLEILLAPVVTVMKSVPVASFIILCLIWLPSRNLSVFITFLMVFPAVYTNVCQGIRETDRELLEMAQVFQVSIGRKVRYIYISQAAPYFQAACRLALGLCWKAGVAAEVIGIPGGSIGEKLYHAKIYLTTPDLFAWTIVIIGLSVLFEKLFLTGIGTLVERMGK